MFSNAGVPFNENSVKRAAATIDPRKCETDRWQVSCREAYLIEPRCLWSSAYAGAHSLF
jgi:hypothetical protein